MSISFPNHSQKTEVYANGEALATTLQDTVDNASTFINEFSQRFDKNIQGMLSTDINTQLSAMKQLSDDLETLLALKIILLLEGEKPHSGPEHMRIAALNLQLGALLTKLEPYMDTLGKNLHKDDIIAKKFPIDATRVDPRYIGINDFQVVEDRN